MEEDTIATKAKHSRSRREDGDKKEESRRGERNRERDGRRLDEKHRRPENGRSVDEKHRESRRSERERSRSVDEKHRERERETRHKEREREKEKAREREKKREKVREREEREKEERERVMEWEREKERERRRARAVERDEEEKEHERKRRRRDDRNDRNNREGSEEVRRKKAEEESAKEKKLAEEDPEEEQRKLDEEMDKRRRRVQEWQELKRKKEEQEMMKSGAVNEEEHAKAGKKWSLEGESDDEEAGHAMKIDNGDDDPKEDVICIDGTNVDSENQKSGGANGSVATVEDDEIDPLDAFMNTLEMPKEEEMDVEGSLRKVDGDQSQTNPPGTTSRLGGGNGGQLKGKKVTMGRIIPGEDSESEYENFENDEAVPEDEDDDEFIKRVKKTKVEKLALVDHSKINYPQFRKNFYIEVKEVARMTAEEVFNYRKQLELKLHGKDVPKPVKTWNQTGLTSKVLDTIKKLGYEKPMPIQAQALPIIMSGRDCIGVAKTGSGKTLAFVLPMLRHIKDQPPVVAGDGPIGLIMAPTRELVQQIHSDIKKFSKVVGLTCVPVYGGSGVAQQISDLKRGAEIVVCTPGRMIDILCTSSGKITNLRRVTYLVMDEADRMFDMGFEPQITRIVQNTRPDRQTVLFSATFPRQVEILARRVLTKPVEIQIGGRSVVNKDITQLVEVRQESERFLRLLELLGEWYEKGKILVFVHSQDKCDSLFKDLLRHGYPCLSLHGAKDQTDRESTISDFKTNVCNLLIATSIAARGLDVKDLELVVNFDVPNHYEDYVHRVGRTGRAGRKGCAITFISEDDARYSPDLVKALELSEQAVPEDLKAIADGFMAKVNQGTEQAHGTGYGGSGFKFNEEEEEARKAAKKAQAREYGFEEDKSDSDSDDDGIRKAGGDLAQATVIAQAAAFAAKAAANPPNSAQVHSNGVMLGSQVPAIAALASLAANPGEVSGAARATALAAAMNLQHNLARLQADALPEHYEAELEINDFPQNARWKVTHKETLCPISEWTGAAITTRGQFYPPGRIPAQGERKLYLFIEGPTESSVKKAKGELKKVLEEFTAQSLNLPGPSQPGKYSVL